MSPKQGGVIRGGRSTRTTLVVAGIAALGVIQFYRPPHPAPTRPFAQRPLAAGASLNAFGSSRAVRLSFALPGDTVGFPLEVSGDPTSLTYEWVSTHDSTALEAPRPLNGPTFVAPLKPGFYHLVLVRGLDREVIPEPMVAVMLPFDQKMGSKINGYRIGTYVAEHFAEHDHPAGFLEVQAADSDLMVSAHLTLAEFITHDSQTDVWPKYLALNPRLLDKLELVLAKVGAHAQFAASGDTGQNVAFDVHSGFRTPTHNRAVPRAASDSRHEYGDAADVAIDADGDGRVTLKDELLVARAVDEVEDEHPDLVGGLGLYVSHLYRTPYVHIDARGTRSRWTG
ncbi:MAG: hypothetical protein ACHQWU_03825 [Gemmatimonadales bacterium]